MIITNAERSAIMSVIEDCKKKAKKDAFEYTNIYMIVFPAVVFAVGLTLYLFGYKAGSLLVLFGILFFGAAMCFGLVFVHGQVRYIGNDHVSNEHLAILKEKVGRRLQFFLDDKIAEKGYITYSELTNFLVVIVDVPFKERLSRFKKKMSK